MTSFRSRGEDPEKKLSLAIHSRTSSLKLQTLEDRKSSIGGWAQDTEDEEPDEIIFNLQISKTHSPNNFRRNIVKKPITPVSFPSQTNLNILKSEPTRVLGSPEQENLKIITPEPPAIEIATMTAMMTPTTESPILPKEQNTEPSLPMKLSERISLSVKKTPRTLQTPNGRTVFFKEKSRQRSSQISLVKTPGKAPTVAKISVPSHIVPQRSQRASQRASQRDEEEVKVENKLIKYDFHKLLLSFQQDKKPEMSSITVPNSLQQSPVNYNDKKYELPELDKSSRRIEEYAQSQSSSFSPGDTFLKSQSNKKLQRAVQSSVVDININLEGELPSFVSQGKLKNLLKNIPDANSPSRRKLGLKKDIVVTGDASHRQSSREPMKITSTSSLHAPFAIKAQNIKFIKPLPTTKAPTSQYKLAQALVNVCSRSQDSSAFQGIGKKEMNRQGSMRGSGNDLDEAVRFLLDANLTGSKNAVNFHNGSMDSSIGADRYNLGNL